ncbi:MAG TPA: hypothetical protein VML35_06220 [Gaiellaceae bacterium]|nr:hypothetical protein [Gaiellaceae bacterium]
MSTATRVRSVATLGALLTAAVVVLSGCGGGAVAEEPVAEEPVVEEPVVEEPVAEKPVVEEPVVEEPVAKEPPPPVTAYVVSYHWGYAIFDQGGSELDALRVPVGTRVELFAVNDHAADAIAKLPAPVTEAIQATDWHARVHHDLMEGRLPDPMEETGMSLDEAIRAAHDGHGDHGMMIDGLGVKGHLDAHAHEPQRLVFEVEEEGTFPFVCSTYCGWGHRYQRSELLVVEAGA